MNKVKHILAAIGALIMLGGCIPALVATGGTTAGVVAAQERSAGNAVDDTGIRLALNDIFINTDFNDLYKNVNINVSEGRVMLTGDVDRQETKEKAGELAWKPKGVREVINELQVGEPQSISSIALDGWISAQIRAKLLAEKNLRSVNYNIETENSIVYIIGIAQDQQELEKVAYIASITPHVKQVISHVILKDDPRRRGM